VPNLLAISSLIGLPWQANAVGPLAFDCKGLVRYVLEKHFDLPTPTLLCATPTTLAGVRESAERQGWRPTPGDAREGDILLCYGPGGAHVGVFVHYQGFGVLHAVQPPAMASGVCFNPLPDLLIGGAFGRASVWRYGRE
jgi:hypothetical protein